MLRSIALGNSKMKTGHPELYHRRKNTPYPFHILTPEVRIHVLLRF